MSCINSSQRFNPFPAKTICAADAVPSKKSFAANRLSQSDKKKRKKKQIFLWGSGALQKVQKAVLCVYWRGSGGFHFRSFFHLKKREFSQRCCHCNMWVEFMLHFVEKNFQVTLRCFCIIMFSFTRLSSMLIQGQSPHVLVRCCFYVNMPSNA